MVREISLCSSVQDQLLIIRVGVDSYEVSLENQTAIVNTTSLDYDTVLNTIKKTGKTVNSGEADGVTANV